MSYRLDRDEMASPRAPSPGVAAVLSVVLPGLGQVYNGRIFAGLIWFLFVGFGYTAILVPGFLLHVICVYCAYSGARDWRGY
jgi:TM2 domain-containing membrane protein YozV